ncbi:microtubule-associated protein 10 [Osmerus mordax]|uniref:microtubule-associated protein 10 n=1 Tax=Osmerus mordax TaxID=8014 RepID=UPI0035106AB0
MSKQLLDYNDETLFSFELFVKYIRVDKLKSWKGSEELALGVRLLDFPTLLIYQPDSAMLHDRDRDEYAKKNELCRYQFETFEYAFNKGKSCLFKINLDSLHTHLSNTPLYAMVLDMSDEIPKLMGTSQISLAKLINQIRCDVEAHGISTPSAQGEKTIVGIFNLMGQNIGFISLGYKLISLGSSLLTHIPENRRIPRGSRHRELFDVVMKNQLQSALHTKTAALQNNTKEMRQMS